MGHPATLSPRLYFPIHSGRLNGNCLSQLVPRYRTSRHLLRRSTFSLCVIDRSCIRHYRGLRTLIPTFHRLHTTWHLIQNPLRRNICRRQLNILPPTLPRPRRNAPPILRLPRRIRPVKHRLLNRLTNLISCCDYIPIHFMRSIRG